MAYATLSDMTIRFGAAQMLLFADRDHDGEIDADQVELAIADADAIVDLHARGRYALPLSPVPAEIVRISCDIARRNLFGDATQIPDNVLQADKAARDLLKLIAAGSVVLECAVAPATAPGAATLKVETSGPAREFTADKLAGF